jgi:hypothetical protein
MNKHAHGSPTQDSGDQKYQKDWYVEGKILEIPPDEWKLTKHLQSSK